MIKYSYALSDSGEMIHIEKVEKSERYDHKYRCLGCGAEMLPRLGEKRQRHFAHKAETDRASCCDETYLHTTAKIQLYENIKGRISSNQPLYLNYPIDIHCATCHFPGEVNEHCFLESVPDRYNLLIHYNQVQLEKKVGDFIPDITLWRPDGDSIFIEIVVTHHSAPEKIDSGNKIVEIMIDSEDDIQHLAQDQINPTALGVQLMGFNFKKKEKEILKKECQYGSKNVFVVYKTGKAALLEGLNNFEYYKLRFLSVSYLEDIAQPESPAEAFIDHVQRVYKKGITIRNCYLCRYHALANEYGMETLQVFCKFLRMKVGNSNKAAKCEFFRADANCFDILQ